MKGSEREGEGGKEGRREREREGEREVPTRCGSMDRRRNVASLGTKRWQTDLTQTRVEGTKLTETTWAGEGGHNSYCGCVLSVGLQPGFSFRGDARPLIYSGPP